MHLNFTTSWVVFTGRWTRMKMRNQSWQKGEVEYNSCLTNSGNRIWCILMIKSDSNATFLSLLLNQLRACIIYSHLHVTLNSYHDWEHLLNILVPAIGQKSTSRLFPSRSVTIRLARFFLLLSNLWLWLYSIFLCVVFFLFNCMLVLFSHFGYNEINIHT